MPTCRHLLNPTLILRSTVNVLADRLDALGVSADDLDGCLQHGIHIRALNAYQGEVAGKIAIHAAFRAKVATARQDPTVIASQDWSGLDAFLDAVMNLLRTCGVPDPAQREGFTR